jgi:hypothetical protein
MAVRPEKVFSSLNTIHLSTQFKYIIWIAANTTVNGTGRQMPTADGKSHQLELVDVSDPAYKIQHAISGNQPFYLFVWVRLNLKYPPTSVGGIHDVGKKG